MLDQVKYPEDWFSHNEAHISFRYKLESFVTGGRRGGMGGGMGGMMPMKMPGMGMMGMMPPMGGRALDQVLMQLLSGGEHLLGMHRIRI